MSASASRVVTSGLLALQLLAATAARATDPAVEVSGPTGERRLSTAQIAALPRAKVTISDHGVKATFEGTEMANLLALVGVPAGEHLRGKELAKVVLIEAADGYRAVFALPELDRAFADRVILLADTRDGKALSEKEGPFRIVVEGEKRQARCVRQVTRIRIVAVP
jgi:molybdopterin-dependent oxidoreductase-like protein protein